MRVNLEMPTEDNRCASNSFDGISTSMDQLRYHNRPVSDAPS